jgi:2'-5' RNA ligase
LTGVEERVKREPKQLMRLFIAVFPPLPVQQAAFALEEALRRPGDLVSWVKRENLHYTVRFLGDLGEDGGRRAAEAVHEAAAAHARFDAELGAVGAFPDARRARVLWASLAEGAEPFTELSRSLEAGLRRRGFERAERPFSPHLTIGRVRNPKEDWTERLAAVRLPAPETLRFTVDRLLLMRSQLSPKGSTYTIQAEGMLGP